MQKSKIETLIKLLRLSFNECQAPISEHQIENIAIIVYDSMSNPGRAFHNINHVFDVAHNLEGISVIAAIFHDVIYYQVDRGFRSSIEPLIYEHIEKNDEHFIVKAPKCELVKKLHIVFGVYEGSELSIFTGLNEFLSAAVALSLLGPILSLDQLIKLAGLIECTIPFRLNPIPTLIERFTHLNFPNTKMDDFIKRSIHFSNNDVLNFAEHDHKIFLNNTWNLISETNYALRRDCDNYTILDYRMALLKSYQFFKHLDPGLVFTRFEKYPPLKDWNVLNKAAVQNVLLGRKYLALQLVSIGAIEAIADLTGGNTSMALLMGEVRRRNQVVTRMEDFLDKIEHHKEGLDKQLMALLEEGRSQESSFDMKNSPIGSFIYKQLGEEKSLSLFESVEKYFERKITSLELLNHYPKNIIKKIIMASAEISSTRRELLIQLASDLGT